MDPRFILTGGLRYEWSFLTSDFRNPLLPYDEILISNGALTGSISAIYHPTEEWQFNLIASTGFRNPNVDDYGKVRAKDEFVTVPNDQIKPEYTYNIELGISRLIEGYMKFDLVGYYTFLRDAIVRSVYSINGQDSLLYDGDYYRITTNINAGQAYIYGLSARATANINPNFLLKGTFNYTKGWNTSDDVPLGHIPPIFGRTSLSYTKNRFSLETYVVYQGWKNIEDFSPFGEDNEEEATRYGFPGWWTANIKVSQEFKHHFTVVVTVENLFDTFYKPYASGISGPGRNIVLAAMFSL
jgi:hemoglobin/transferrin/lactoferrin receptor protein